MSMTRWGILGAAKFAREHMAPAIALAENAQLAAIATRSAQKAEDFRAFNADLRVHCDYDALLDDPQIDAVYIPLPNDMHTPWAIKALEAGKAVLVEKPASLSTAELDCLIAARDASGRFAAEAYMIVHHPQWRKMREIFQSGVLGDMRRVDGVFTYDNSGDPENIRHHAARGGGSVPDIGVYPYGAVRYVTGQEPVEFLSKHIERQGGVDLSARICAAFDGFTFTACTSMRMMRWQGMEFHGSRALARLSAPFNPGVFGEARLELHHADGCFECFRWPQDNQYVLQIEAFQRAMQGESYACPLEFSRGTQVMIDAVLG
ncbi:Gfo/Idh/MocA family protein [Planktotalea arctica]|uniref:Gfo/Idh/MocA family protein n=1 Tax=Planktotalea arctica TaxID=1481893 RepID=UPI0032195747